MFDLTSYIRQYFPVNLRTDLNVAFVNILFAPIASLILSIEQTRRNLMYQARATGQVIVLEELCNVAIYGADLPGTIYLLDSNANSVDFQVVIPNGLNDELKSKLRGVLDKNKQAGKRYEFVVDSNWTVPVPEPGTGNEQLTWESGFPVLTDDGLIKFAIQQTGQFQVTLKEDNTVQYDQVFGFIAGYPQALGAASTTATYTITIGNLSVSLVRDVVVTPTPPVIERITFVRSGTLIMLLTQVDKGDIQTKLVGRDGTVRAGDYTDSAVWGSKINNLDYNRRTLYESIPDGKYRAYFRVKGQSAEQTIDLDFTTSVGNQSPVVSVPIQDQVGKVGVPYAYQIANTVFTDPDGSIVSVAATGWPAGISYDPATRTATGTPTTAGNYTITATATDNKGATVSDQFFITIQAVDAPPPQIPNGTYSGTLQWNVKPREEQYLKPRVIDFDAATGRFRMTNDGTDKSGFYNYILDDWIDDGAVEDYWWPCGWPILWKVFKPIGNTDGWGQPRIYKNDRRNQPTTNTHCSFQVI